MFSAWWKRRALFQPRDAVRGERRRLAGVAQGSRLLPRDAEAEPGATVANSEFPMCLKAFKYRDTDEALLASKSAARRSLNGNSRLNGATLCPHKSSFWRRPAAYPEARPLRRGLPRDCCSEGWGPSVYFHRRPALSSQPHFARSSRPSSFSRWLRVSVSSVPSRRITR